MTLPRRPPDTTPPTPGAVTAKAPVTPSGASVASLMGPVLARLLGESLSVRFVFCDGSTTGPADSDGAVVIRSANVLRHLLWAPGELGLARAFVTGDIDVEGNIIDVVEALSGRLVKGDVPSGPVATATALRAALRLH